MKLKVIIVGMCLALYPASCLAGAAIVQSTNNNVGSVSATSLATTVNATKVGDFIAVAIATDGANALTVTISSVTDGTNTYSQVVTKTQSGTINERVSLWAASNVSAGITSVTVNISGALGASGGIQVIIAEYSGVDTGSVASITNTTASNSNAGSTSASVTVTPTANTITIATVNCSPVSNPDGTNPFSQRQNPAVGNAYADNLKSVSATYTPTFKLASSDNWAMVAASFTVSSSFNTGSVTEILDMAGVCGSPATGNTASACGASVQSFVFSFTPEQTNDGILFSLGCGNNSPSAVSLSATGWTFTQVGSIIGSNSLGWQALFKAYSPNTSTASITASWTTSGGCASFMNDLIGEFAIEDLTNFIDNGSGSGQSSTGTSGCALTVTPVTNNDAIWFACQDNISAVGGSFIKGADDLVSDWTEFQTINGNSSTAANFTSSGNMTIFGIAVKPASGVVSPFSVNKRRKLSLLGVL